MTNSDGTEAKAARKARLVGAWTTQLADLVKSTNLTQAAFAKRVGVDPSTITRYLKGQSMPAEDRVQAILDAQPQPLPDHEPARTWQVWAAACEVASQHEYEKHQLRGQMRQVRGQIDDLQTRLDRAQSDHAQAVQELAQVGLALTQAHRDLADTRRQLRAAEDSRDRERAARRQKERILEQAIDRLDRMKDAYEQLQQQARLLLEARDINAETWQQRQAELLERLAVAEERRAEAERLVQTGLLALTAEREAGQAAREEAAQARQRVADSIRQASDARQAASEAEARRLKHEKEARQAVRAAEGRYTQASATITRLRAELDDMRQERDAARARLAAVKEDLARAESERAVEDSASAIVDQAFQDQQQDTELAPTHSRLRPRSPARQPSNPSPWFDQGRSRTQSTPTAPTQQAPTPEAFHAPSPVGPSNPSQTDDDDLTPGALAPRPDTQAPSLHSAPHLAQSLTGADARHDTTPGTRPTPHRPSSPSTSAPGTTPKSVHDGPTSSGPGRHTAPSHAHPWKSLGAVVVGLAAVVTCGLYFKDRDVLTPSGPIEFTSGSKPTTETGKGEYGAGSLSYSWKLAGGSTVKAHFDLTRQGGSDLPGQFTARPLDGCRPDLTWTLTADAQEEEIEVASGEITSAGRYGINGDVGDADSLDLIIKPKRPTSCTVTVTWGITTW